MPQHGISLSAAPPFPDFKEACGGVLAYLHERFGGGLWLVTRAHGDQQIVLCVVDTQSHGIAVGHTFRWTDLEIGAFAGASLELPDGRIFGTLCGVDRAPSDGRFDHETPAIQMYARLLSTILVSELEAELEAGRAQRAEDAAFRDQLTGLPNRRAWDTAIETEEDRCRRYGSPAAVLSLDVDGLKEANDREGHSAGDDLLRRTGTVLLSSVRRHDMVARLGGDEFGVLLPECSEDEAHELAERVRARLDIAGVAASVGWAQRMPDGGGLMAAFERADQRMYAAKRGRG